jgi:hypothetical protein
MLTPHEETQCLMNLLNGEEPFASISERLLELHHQHQTDRDKNENSDQQPSR